MTEFYFIPLLVESILFLVFSKNFINANTKIRC